MPLYLSPRVFADTSFFVADLIKGCRAHDAVQELLRDFKTGKFAIFTSEFILLEFLDSFPGQRYPIYLRSRALEYVDEMRKNMNKQIKIIPLTETALFFRALEKYRKTPDKKWSLTDCTSFEIMEKYEIEQAASTDSDFEQAGYLNLLQPDRKRSQ